MDLKRFGSPRFYVNICLSDTFSGYIQIFLFQKISISYKSDATTLSLEETEFCTKAPRDESFDTIEIKKEERKKEKETTPILNFSREAMLQHGLFAG